MDCKEDISDRGRNAKRCEECAAKHFRAYRSTWQNRKRWTAKPPMISVRNTTCREIIPDETLAILEHESIEAIIAGAKELGGKKR